MDETGPRIEGVMLMVTAMLGLMALVLAVWAAWRGWRRTRGGATRGALVVTNLLVAVNAVALALVIPYAPVAARNPVAWVWLLVTLPPLAGYVLGSSAGMIASRRRRG